MVPNQAKPEVTAPSGRVALSPTKPAWMKEPSVGVMKSSSVSFKVTPSLVAVIVHGTVMSDESVVKVMFVARV